MVEEPNTNSSSTMLAVAGGLGLLLLCCLVALGSIGAGLFISLRSAV